MLLIIDFGSQYTHLIARRVREKNVLSEIVPFDISFDKLCTKNFSSVILSGGPGSITSAKTPPHLEHAIWDYIKTYPILGICYGLHEINYQLGGKLIHTNKKEFGRTTLTIHNSDVVFNMIPVDFFDVWMSHSDHIDVLAPVCIPLASTKECTHAIIKVIDKQIYGTQFHPEVNHTQYGKRFLDNFIFTIAKADKDWDLDHCMENIINNIKEKVGDSCVVGGLSGGVDSTVAAVLCKRAIGDKFIGIFVDHGFMRKNEGVEVEQMLKSIGINLIHANSKEFFMKKIKGVDDPEKKRKIIGHAFIDVFEDEVNKLNHSEDFVENKKEIRFLLQGTIYPDVIESGKAGVSSRVIKTHHNVGGLKDKMKFSLVEPLRCFFKDEVKKIGMMLNLPDKYVYRQPFPGPGLAIRIMGKITQKKINILQEVDYEFQALLEQYQIKSSQAFAVLLKAETVGVMGDQRTYSYAVALRAVDTTDFMTGDVTMIPIEILVQLSTHLINKVDGINRVVYDITSKPPATIEWE